MFVRIFPNNYTKTIYRNLSDGEMITRLGGDNFVMLVKKESLREYIDMLSFMNIRYDDGKVSKDFIFSATIGYSLPDHPDHALYEKYFPNGGASIFTFNIKGGQKEAFEFIDHLQIFSLLANVADVKSLVIPLCP